MMKFLLIQVTATFLLSMTPLAFASGGKKSKACFANDLEAGAIASVHLANFLADVLATGCDAYKISYVWDDYFTEDCQVLVGGGPLLDGLDEIQAVFSPVYADICASTLLTWETFGVDPVDPSMGTFTWLGRENMVVVYPDLAPADNGLPAGRHYDFVFDKKCAPKIASINIV
uniref:Uncharacterized protein n=1 Tax=Entomoneis paludosa TaxID=265537 RepID=A0A7S2YPH5_9STRA|eukprot:CAMPEP_0172455010 /NCGR_PEP_ID=MMETSP1065-20121228/11826_1 /TAXON_ID=265537 /ORGANISM="Amphiprora paludosa, Strain CCMP125" /LENGTH=172 /DNA_ID=CAMNT_0013207441 /DNA_START=75 /DNA_END=593 /DNA_ORIENTATION=+